MNIHQTEKFVLAKRHFDENQYRAACPLLLSLASTGDCQSQFMYGECLLFSGARIVNVIEWLKKSAAQGSIDAFRTLGMIYDPGFHFAGREDDESLKDDGQATEFYRLGLQRARQLAEDGDAYAQYCLGSSLLMLDLLNSRGTLNFQEGLRWLELAATKGNPMAAWLIALEYLSGRELSEDVALAKMWYQLARKNGLNLSGACAQSIRIVDPDLFSFP